MKETRTVYLIRKMFIRLLDSKYRDANWAKVEGAVDLIDKKLPALKNLVKKHANQNCVEIIRQIMNSCAVALRALDNPDLDQIKMKREALKSFGSKHR